MKIRNWLIGGLALAAAALAGPAAAEAPKAQVTLIYDAFGKSAKLEKDWGFAAYVEYGGKRILFDTGNNAEVFARNVAAAGIDLTKLDFVVVSHRHGDHTSGLNHLLKVNSKVPIYAPKENFGVFGAALPGKFIKPNEALPAEMRYYDGKVPDKLRFGSAWPEGNFTWVTENMEIAPGFRLLVLKGSWGVDLDVMEVSLAVDTPDGVVLIVGCSHPTIEKIVEAAKATTDKPIHLVVGGTHLLPAKDEDIARIAGALRDTLKVDYIAPAHCTGEAAFATLKQAFGERYLYAGLGTTLVLGPKVVGLAESGQPQVQALDAEDLRNFNRLMAHSDDNPASTLASYRQVLHRLLLALAH
jgi:7,8-dihydropterin-6-yl-methyl-4-(beta-D-ribofuranosyl)aminobenzene 5'-phosphate synthase